MNHKTISKFVLGLFMVASLGLSGIHSHAADMMSKACLTHSKVCAS